jgi:hypothetical protein
MGDSNAYNAQTKGMNYMMFSPIAWNSWNYDPFWHQVENICHIQLKNNLVEVKVQGAHDVMDYCFTSALGCYFELVWREMWCKGIVKLKA